MTSTNERFIEDCRFAKIVSTADGPAILIAGEVIGIRSDTPHFHVDCITKALRRSHRGEVGEAIPVSDSSQPRPVTGGCQSTPPVQ